MLHYWAESIQQRVWGGVWGIPAYLTEKKNLAEAPTDKEKSMVWASWGGRII